MAKKDYNHDINQDLYLIIEQNAQITPGSIELFLKVAYPIAILEIETQEKTYEDFDFIPLTVLKFVKAGVYKANEIAGLTGLSEMYSQKVLDLLAGYGHVNASGITEIGEESLEKGQMIKTYDAKQLFQADALTGDLLRLREQTLKKDQKEVQSIDENTPIIPHVEGVSADQINKQLTESNIQNYMQYSGEILNANVVKIGSVQCIDLVYIEAYMLKLKDISVPFIIMEQHDNSIGNYKPSFQWRPIRLLDRQAGIKYGFSRMVPCYGTKACSLIQRSYELVTGRVRSMSIDNVKNILRNLYPFEIPPTVIDASGISNLNQIKIKVDKNSFKKWRRFILTFLEHFDRTEGFIYSYPKLNGMVLHFVSEDVEIIYYSDLWKKTLDGSDGKRSLKDAVNERMVEQCTNKIVPFDFRLLDDVIKNILKSNDDETDEEDVSAMNQADIVDSEIWIQKLDSDKNGDARFNLAEIEHEKGTHRAEEPCRSWYFEAADAGHPEASYHTALIYRSENENEKYLEYLKRSADAGFPEAKYKYGLFLRDKDGRTESEAREAFNYLKSAAHGGCVDAMFSVGYSYSEGLGVEKDGREAIKWFGQHIAKGGSDSVKANSNIGVIYFHGRNNLPKNYSKAFEAFEIAADQDYPKAQYYMGKYFDYGYDHVVEIDHVEAHEWYMKAANQNNAKAQFCVAYNFKYGEGTRVDMEQAYFWYQKAADQNYQKAINELGDAYNTKSITDWYKKIGK